VDFYKRMNRVIEMIDHENQDLSELASKSGFDPYSFYQSADLRNINLNDQDLRGLNFDGADFRGAIITNIEYDNGSFNRSLIDNLNISLIDEFDVTIYDVMALRGLFVYDYVLFSFRPGIIDRLSDTLLLTYRDIALRCNVSTATLRSARHGFEVANHTAVSIAQGITGIFNDRNIIKRAESIYRGSGNIVAKAVAAISQPNLACYKDNYYGPRAQINIDKLVERYAYLKSRGFMKNYPDLEEAYRKIAMPPSVTE
jgi:hypothetical protein